MNTFLVFLFLLLVAALALWLGATYIPVIGDVIRFLFDPTWVTKRWGK